MVFAHRSRRTPIPLLLGSFMLLWVGSAGSGCENDEMSTAAPPPPPPRPQTVVPTAEPENVAEKCKELRKVMERGARAIDDGTAALAEDPASLDAMDDMASKVGATSREAVAVKAIDPELQGITMDYVNATQAINTAITELAGSLEGEDLQKTQNAQRDLEEAVGRAKPLVDKVKKICPG